MKGGVGNVSLLGCMQTYPCAKNIYITKRMTKRFTSYASCTIKMCSREEDKLKALTPLKQDLINGPYHCFDHHTSCSPDFCHAAQDASASSANRESNLWRMKIYVQQRAQMMTITLILHVNMHDDILYMYIHTIFPCGSNSSAAKFQGQHLQCSTQHPQ